MGGVGWGVGGGVDRTEDGRGGEKKAGENKKGKMQRK